MIKNICIIVLSVLCFVLFGMALFYNAQYNDLEKSVEESKNAKSEIVNLLDGTLFYPLNFYNPDEGYNTQSVLLGVYEIDEKDYRIAIEYKDEEYVQDDVNMIRSHYYVFVNYKSYEIPFSITEVNLINNLLYINGYDDDYYAACIFDVVSGKIIKHYENGNITNQTFLVGDDWDNRRMYNVCENDTLYIRSFAENDINDDILYNKISNVHCNQED